MVHVVVRRSSARPRPARSRCNGVAERRGWGVRAAAPGRRCREGEATLHAHARTYTHAHGRTHENRFCRSALNRVWISRPRALLTTVTATYYKIPYRLVFRVSFRRPFCSHPGRRHAVPKQASNYCCCIPEK